VKLRVPDAEVADEIIVSACSANGVALYLVRSDATGVTRHPETSVDGTRRSSTLEMLDAMEAYIAQMGN